MNGELPNTFPIPSDEDKSAVKQGNFVKVGVRWTYGAVTGERFWVIVSERDGDRFTGRINNDLACTRKHGLRDGDEIQFESRHILDYLPKGEFHA